MLLPPPGSTRTDPLCPFTTLFLSMNQSGNVACGATEPLETQDDEFVIGAQELHDRLNLRASSARCARACFGAEDFTARCLQPGNLDVEILVDGADAGVADAGQDRKSTRLNSSQ